MKWLTPVDWELAANASRRIRHHVPDTAKYLRFLVVFSLTIFVNAWRSISPAHILARKHIICVFLTPITGEIVKNGARRS